MNIIIFYQHIERERQAVLSITEEFRKRNVSTYVFSIDFEYCKALSILKKIKIDAIIMPWMYHDNNYKFMLPFLNKNRNTMIFNLHSEQISSPYSKKLLMPTGELAKNGVIHLVWGEYFRQHLIDNGVKESLIYITGNTRTDFIKTKSYYKEFLAEQYNLDIKKKWILFSDNRGWVYIWNDKYKRERLISGLKKEDIEAEYLLAKESMEASIIDFNKLSDNFFEKYEFIYRPHPGTLPPNNLNKNIKIVSDYSIYEWLNNIDVNVVWSSTTIFESDAMKIPSIVYEPIPNQEFYKTDGISNYIKIKSISEINENLINEAIKEQNNKENYKKYLGNVDGKCCEKTVELVLTLLEKQFSITVENTIVVKKRELLKKYLFEKTTLIMSKLGLVEKFKYPKSAYSSFKNIPWLFGKDLIN